MGRVPAARCNIKNINSKSTLLKAGMKVCGYILQGELSPSTITIWLLVTPTRKPDGYLGSTSLMSLNQVIHACRTLETWQV